MKHTCTAGGRGGGRGEKRDKVGVRRDGTVRKGRVNFGTSHPSPWINGIVRSGRGCRAPPPRFPRSLLPHFLSFIASSSIPLFVRLFVQLLYCEDTSLQHLTGTLTAGPPSSEILRSEIPFFFGVRLWRSRQLPIDGV